MSINDIAASGAANWCHLVPQTL